MAATSIHPIHVTESAAIDYIINPEKTQGGQLVQSFMCANTASKAAEDFRQVRDSGTGRGSVLCQHIIQSFKPEEVTPETAMKIGLELCDRLLKDQYQYIIATHTDTECIHNHIILNNTNFTNGKSFEYLENRGGKVWKKLQEISDDICRRHHLSVIENPETSRGKSYYEWDLHRQGLSWKSKLKYAIDQVIKQSDDFEDFLLKCKAHGILVDYNPSHKIDLKFMLAEQKERNPRAKFTRSRTLGWYYETEQIKRRIAMYKGVMSYVPRTKVIRTTADKFQLAPAFQKWADRQNMKEVSRAINILTKYRLQPNEVEYRSLSRFAQLGALSEDLNRIHTQIEDIDLQIKTIGIYQKYKPISDTLKSLSGRQKSKYQTDHSTEIDRFNKALKQLHEWHPSGQVPSAETLEKKRSELTAELSEKNSQYKNLKAEVAELNYARQAVEDYLKNERDVQEIKRRKGDLE